MVEGSPVRSVVIPMAAGVGNAIMATPMVRQLHAGLGRPRITVIAFNRGIAGVFANMPEVAEIKISGPGRRGLFRFLRWTRQRRPDVYVVPYPSNRWQYNLLLAASGARHRVTHAYATGRWRAMHVAPAVRVPADPALHDVHQNLRMLIPLGITPDETQVPRFDVRAAEDAAAVIALQSIGIAAGESFVAVHPGSGDTGWGAAKRWPAAHFATLCRRLTEGPDAVARRVLVVEGPDERGLASEVISMTDNAKNVHAVALGGSLGDSAALLRRATLYVGSDSALAHLASAVGTPTVALYAPTDPATCRPISAPHWSVRLDKTCAPCFDYPQRATRPTVRCRPPYCIGEISVDDVLNTVREALASLPATRVRSGPL